MKSKFIIKFKAEEPGDAMLFKYTFSFVTDIAYEDLTNDTIRELCLYFLLLKYGKDRQIFFDHVTNIKQIK